MVNMNDFTSFRFYTWQQLSNLYQNLHIIFTDYLHNDVLAS